MTKDSRDQESQLAPWLWGRVKLIIESAKKPKESTMVDLCKYSSLKCKIYA
jgi:hypothetical protein